MDLRTRIACALKEAMREKSAHRLSTLRLINAAIKDRDIALRGEGSESLVGDSEILSILGKMAKQRQESAKMYEEGGRLDLAERERSEIAVIGEFLPRQMNTKDITQAVDTAVETLNAESIRDMGRVMAHLKEHHTGEMDFSVAGPLVKARLSA